MSEPARLGKYEIVETLGKGAMGVVYRAFDPDIHRTVAIKTIRKELVDDDERAAMMFARFRNEARAAGRLSHPGIVAVHDYGDTGELTYIAMEFVQGSSLRDYFNKGTRFREHDIVSIMTQLLDGLQHAHEQGVWHRDIKPANLIIMDTGRLKIADFGIAKVDTAQLTQTGLVMGSPGYMAPEQYSGGAVDWRADLFAAGVVMYQLLTGQRAFAGTTEQMAYKICHITPPPPSQADPGQGWERYDAVVMRALAKEPDARFQTAESFRAAIVAVYAAPVSPTVSEDTIIAEAARPAVVFEPSSPSARTFTDMTPLPAVRPVAAASARAVDPEAPTVAASGAAGAASSHRRTLYVAAGVAAVALAAGVGWFVRGKPEPAPVAKPAAQEATVAAAEPAPTAVPPAPAPALEPRTEAAQTAKPAPASGRAMQPAPAVPQPAPRGEKSATVATTPRPASKPPPAARAEEAPTGFWRDQGINTKVAAKLHFNRKLWRSGIQVETRDGVVTLRGNVPSQALIAEAVSIASGVAGVRSVRSELRIGSPDLSAPNAGANP
jgi:serine/threonine-protein kinase